MVHKTSKAYKLILLVLLILLVFSLTACQPVEKYNGPIYGIDDNESNKINKDNTQKQDAIKKVTSSITNLKKHLNSEDVGEGGYYLGFDFHINTAMNANFVLKLQAHLFTWPYMSGDVIREDDLKKHNEIIKKSTILLEWYDGITNSMLIGFYYDGVKANPNDPGNILYLNLQGEKRWFPDFGDSVLFQQMIRLITNFSLDDILAGAGIGEDGGVSALETVLMQVITNNYKLVVNHNEKTNKDITSVLFSSIGVDLITNAITGFIQNLFGPFQNKIDPLTNKYLGFKFSTLGGTSITSLTTDLQFFVEPDTDGVDDMLTSAYASMVGVAATKDASSVPFTSQIRIYYGAAPPRPIELDKEFYKYYDYGKYEFTGELYLPNMDLRLDALIRTKVNEYDNSTNHVFAEFRDIANGDLIIGTYYKNELAYIDIEGLQHLYGGIKIEDIGFPKVYIEGWDLARMLKGFFDMVDNTIISIVDRLLDPEKGQQSDMLQVILEKMASTEKDPNNPLSRNTVMIRIDHELIKNVLREGGYGTFTTRDIINIINAQLPITLDELATILGITSAEVLLEKTWIKFTLDVDTNQITIQIYSDIGIMNEEDPSKLLMQLDLTPVKIGEDMKIAEINFDDFNELLPIYTYSAVMGGQFLFSNAEVVDLSLLLSSFMDDISGLNTPYILPMETKLDFTLVYDQYIKAQYLQKVPGGDRTGRWTEASRNAFILNVFIKGATPEDNVTLFNIYANDVSFKSDAPEEELGYIWIDLVCLRSDPNVQNIPKFKIREDYWLQSVNRYLNSTGASDDVGNMLNPDISLSITTIISALIEDSFVVFQPDQIEITTSNETVQNIFGVKSLIGNIHTQVGLVQRVFGIDEIENEFAHYTVGTFEEIVGFSPYTTKLHDTIDVTFTFNQNGRTWNEVVPMKFEYLASSVTINGDNVYYPTIRGPIIEYKDGPTVHRFMGEKDKKYKLTFTGDRRFLLPIISLADNDWYDPENGTIITKQEVAAYPEHSLEKAYFDSIKHRLLPHYRLEPMLPKPSQIMVSNSENQELPYNAEVLIDWTKMTAAGGEFFTQFLIAEGMMGETRFPTYIIVTNRVIDTSTKNPKVVNVTVDENSDQLTEAPVIDTITIDPYDYLWAKAIFFKENYRETSNDPVVIEANRKAMSIEFIRHYFKNFNIAISFVDFDTDVIDYRDTPIYYDNHQYYFDTAKGEYVDNRLVWYFDKYEPTKYYKETDIVLTGGSTYLHANFLGQIVALQVIIESLTIVGVNFGEEQDNVYTVDMLDPDSYIIPEFPLITFKDSSQRLITKRFKDAENGIEVPMRWSHKEVTNPSIGGTDTPFKGYSGNETSSFIDFFKELGVGEWIFKDYSPIVVIRVDCPSKEMADLDIEPIIGYDSYYNWLNDIPTEIRPSYIKVGDYSHGFYHVDPFNPSTFSIPTTVTITFKGRLEGDATYTKTYNDIVWDTSTGLVNLVNGKYTLAVNSENETYIMLKATKSVENVGSIEIILCVKILTSNYSEITFYDDLNNEMSDITEINVESYRYYVDTYQGFKLPTTFKALFGESDERYYPANWKGFNGVDYVVNLENIKFEPNSIIYLRTTLPGANGSVLNVDLEIRVLNVTLEDIIFTNIPMIKINGQLVSLPILLNLNTQELTIGGTTAQDVIKLNAEGKIENLYFGRGFYENSKYQFSGVNVPFIEGVQNEWGEYIQQPVAPVSLYPYEFLQLLFLNTCLVFNHENGEKLVRDYQIHNLKGVMDIKDIVQRTGDTSSFGYGNGKYSIRLGQGKGAKDLLIKIRFVEGFYPIQDSVENYRVHIYDNNGDALWGDNGFVLGDNISASVTVSVQALGSQGNLVTYVYGPNYTGAKRLNEWYVEHSNIASLPVGSYITSLPQSLLYDSAATTYMQLRISYLTEEGFRIVRNIDIVEVNFGSMYNSVASHNDLFIIENGKVVIEDLYQFYPLNLYLSNADYLPKTITYQVSTDYTITITDIRWNIHSNWRAFLNNYTYQGDVADILLATTEILGWYTIETVNGVPYRVYQNRESLNLYIRVKSAQVVTLSLEQSHGLTTGFEDITVTNAPSDENARYRIAELFGATTVGGSYSYREYIINVDAYKNSNYQGIFIPPANLVVSYMSGLRHTFSGLRYTYRGIEISEIRYDINGIILFNDHNGNYIMAGTQKIYLMRGDNRYNITLRVSLGAEQVLAIKIHFYDKSVVAVRPIINYSDQEVRDHISNELSALMEKTMADLQYSINITKLEYEITTIIAKNIQLKESVDRRTILNMIKNNFNLQYMSQAEAQEELRNLLNRLPDVFPNPYGDAIFHNYAAQIIIDVYGRLLDDGINSVYQALSAYLNNNNGIMFSDVENAVNAFFDSVYSESARLIINNKIIDFVEIKILSEIQSMAPSQRTYVVKLTNTIEAKLNVQGVLNKINNILATEESAITTAIAQILNDEFNRMLNEAKNESNDSDELKNAVTSFMLQRKNDMQGEFIALCTALTPMFINKTSGMRDAIEIYFKNFFDLVGGTYSGAILDTTVFAIRQEIERTSRNLVVEMRASMAAGLAVNTGGRLSRAVNLSIAAAVNNVLLEGRIVDAIRKARNLNSNNTDNGHYAIDPYSDYIFVPTRTEVLFSDINGGESYVVNINWDKPAHWSTPRNPNAGVTFRGNEGDLRDARFDSWTILFNEIETIYFNVLGSGGALQLTVEQDLLYNQMTSIINSIYDERPNGWTDLVNDIDVSAAYLALIESRVLIRYPGVTGAIKENHCFQMWAGIEAWERLKISTVNDDIETSINEQAVWDRLKATFPRKELAQLRDEFTATLYSEGIQSQNLSLIIMVHNRRLDTNTWNLYNSNDGTHCSKTDPIYHIEDPFTGRVADFPNTINLDDGIIVDMNLVNFSDLLVNWEYTDQAITYAGTVFINENTGKMGIIVTGYVKNSRVGQQVTLRLIVNAWEYNDTSGSGIRQYNGSGDINDENNYTIMNPASFIFSKLVNYSAQEQYQVMIKETKYVLNPITGAESTQIVYKNVFFYPEDSLLVRSSIDDEEMEEIARRRNYMLYWDNDAKNNAFNTGATVLGSFSLGNSHKNKLTRANSAYYQYEETYISKVKATDYTVESLKDWFLSSGEATTEAEALSMAQAQINELYGTTGVSLLVINPLDPKLPATVEAIGILNQISNTNLGQVRVFWNKSYSKAVLDMTAFVRYMYPTLTSNEAQRSAMELLINTTRSKAQEKELIDNVIGWLKNTWQVENFTNLSDKEEENWDIYYNKSSSSPSIKARMDNLMTTVFLKNGSRVTSADKFEGWYRMYEFLPIRNSIELKTENEKVEAWNSLVMNSNLIALRNNVSSANPGLSNNAVTALAYDIYIKSQKWLQLSQRYIVLQYTKLANEMSTLRNKVAAENPGLTDYQHYAMCWDIYDEFYQYEEVGLLDGLLYTYGNIETAWDKWIKTTAFREWMIRQAKDMLLIDEIYDMQTSPHYLGGGIDGTKTVTLLLQLTEGGYIYTQTFKIRIAFLDLQPLAYYSDVAGNLVLNSISRTNPPTELTIAVKTDYKLSDYAGVINPYSTNQQMIYRMLDYFSEQAFAGEIVNRMISGSTKNVKLIRITNIVWNIPPGSVSGTTVYSSSFTIGDKTYQSKLLKMVLQ